MSLALGSVVVREGGPTWRRSKAMEGGLDQLADPRCGAWRSLGGGCGERAMSVPQRKNTTDSKCDVERVLAGQRAMWRQDLGDGGGEIGARRQLGEFARHHVARMDHLIKELPGDTVRWSGMGAPSGSLGASTMKAR
jgi:hypothetical protein